LMSMQLLLQTHMVNRYGATYQKEDSCEH
jgi:hypothetical protein